MADVIAGQTIVLKLHVIKRIIRRELQAPYALVHEASEDVSVERWQERLDACKTWLDLQVLCYKMYGMDLQEWANSL